MVDQYQIQSWADEVADRFLKEQAPLNDSILKIARDEGLATESIARIVERANTGVQTALYSEYGPKEVFEFDMASTRDILDELNEPTPESQEQEGEENKEASQDTGMEKVDWNVRNAAPTMMRMIRLSVALSVMRDCRIDVLTAAVVQ